VNLFFFQIMEDFSCMQPDAADKLAVVWPRLYTSLLEKLRQLKVSDKQLNKLVKILQADVENPKPAGNSCDSKRISKYTVALYYRHLNCQCRAYVKGQLLAVFRYVRNHTGSSQFFYWSFFKIHCLNHTGGTFF
jgi:hypothetical protein